MTKINDNYFKTVLQDFDACLAPLAGVTDLAFRKICLDMGADMMVTEMVSAKGIVYKNKNTQSLLLHDNREKNTGVQIFGADIQALESAVKDKLNHTPFSFIDINMGCPVKKIVSNGEGSALLLDLKTLAQVAKTVVRASVKPVSAKIRLGFDDEHINCVETAKILEDCGINMITVHARTREQFYSGKADWDKIAQVKQAVRIPVLANGDVVQVEDYTKIKQHTCADGVMIGRAAMGNPFIFRQIREFNRNGHYAPITPSERIKAAQRHFHYLLSCTDEGHACMEFRKHLCWYTKGLHDSAKMRGKINSITSKEELYRILSELYERNL